jgi:hypothetical protein
MRSLLRVVRRLALELALVLAAVGCASMLSIRSALGVLALGLTGAAAGALWHWSRGALALAWRCPRLDALGLTVGGRDLPWAALGAADAALRVLDEEGRAFRTFFPDARLQLIKTATRTLDAHRLGRRAQRAIAHTPMGEGRIRLERQQLRADDEVAALTGLLMELRGRFIAATRPVASVECPLPDLQALTERTQALEASLDLADHSQEVRS